MSLPRVLLVHGYYRSGAPSGESAVFEAERDLLAAYGHDVATYVRRADDIDGAAGQVRAGLDAIWARRTRRDVAALIRRERPDVVHFHNIFPLISPSAYAACKDAGVPVVQTVHNYRMRCANGLMFRDGAGCSSCITASPAAAVGHGCYRNSRAASAVAVTAMTAHRTLRVYERLVDRFVAPSRFVAATLHGWGTDPARVVVKPHFVSDGGAPPPGKRAGVAFVGRLSAEKGIGILIAARRSMPAPLTIVGDGPMAPAVRSLAAHDSGVTWRRSLSPAEVRDVMRASLAVVVPSLAPETFGRVVAEAFEAGTPVVAARSGALPEAVEDGRSGLLVDAGDPDALAEAIDRIHADPQRAARMGSAARIRYEQRYAPGTNYAILADLYEALRRRSGVHSRG